MCAQGGGVRSVCIGPLAVHPLENFGKLFSGFAIRLLMAWANRCSTLLPGTDNFFGGYFTHFGVRILLGGLKSFQASSSHLQAGP